MTFIRPEQAADHRAIHHVVAEAFQQAFGSTAEARLVDRLRANGKAVVSLVAVDDARIVGHVMFSEVALGEVRILGLAPLSVLPSHQRQGIGVQLTSAGIEACRSKGYGAIVVLGHPRYYPRFGFVPASRFAIRSEYEGSDETFLALELRPGALADRAGVARYQPEFGEL